MKKSSNSFEKSASRHRLLAMAHLKSRLPILRRDPNEFIAFCFSTRDVRFVQSDLHRELQEFLFRSPKGLIELPRDHGKSTQICGRILWELGHRPDLRVKLVCSTDALAAERTRFLRDAIEGNPRLRFVFPNLRPATPWAAEAFSIERNTNTIGPSVAAFGIGSGSTGARADLLVCDDIVDVAAVYSKAERDKVTNFFHDNLLNLLEPDGRFWGLFTPWHPDDCNSRLKKNNIFAQFRRAIDADLTPIWPEKWTREKLEERRREIGDSAFTRGYRLSPVDESEILIQPQWVQYWTQDVDQYDRVILSVDPAISTKATADNSALVVLGRSQNHIDCLALVARRVMSPDLVAMIDEMNTIWNPDIILFESNAAFAALRDLLIHHARFGPKIQSIVQVRQKSARMATFAVTVQNGCFRLKADGSQQELFREMTTFPFGDHDDRLDAAATGTAYLLANPSSPRIWFP